MPTDPVLDLIANLVIDSTLQTPSRPGFGAAMIMAPDAPPSFGSASVVRVTDPAEVTALGFAANSRTMRDVNAYFAQSPRPQDAYIGRRLSKPTRVVTLTIVDAEIGAVFGITINGNRYTFTAVDAVEANVATGLAAAINAGDAGYGKAAVGAVVTLTATVPGVMPEIKDWTATLPTGPTAAKILIEETTDDPGISDDLAACFGTPLGGQAFGLLTPGAGPEEVTAATVWAAANRRLYSAQLFGSSLIDANVEDDTASDLNALAPGFLLLTIRKSDTDSPIAAGIVGRCFPYTPGSVNFAHKSVALATAEAWTASEIEAVHAKGANVYAVVQGANIFFDGRMSGGGWADEVIAEEFTASEIKISVFEEFLAQKKIPYTEAGFDLLRARVKGVLLLLSQEPYNIIDPDREILVVMPTLASLTAQQRASRVIPDILFDAFKQGAVNRVRMKGRIRP